MIHADDAKLSVAQDAERLVIREVDALWRPMRVALSLVPVCLGVFVLYVVGKGGGMKAATTAQEVFAKVVFLGVFGLIFGGVPLAFGLRLWLGREEIVVHSTGRIERHLYFCGWRLRSVSVEGVRPADVGIRYWGGVKTGDHHEVVLFSNDPKRRVRLISLRRRVDAERWQHRVWRQLVSVGGGGGRGSEGF